jgi:thiol-disulfide isomerase/thioredoxin
MKKLIASLALFMLISHATVAQNVVLHIAIDHIKAPKCFVVIPAQIKNNFSEIPLLPGKTAQHTFVLAQPGFVTLSCSDLSDGSRYLSYILYLSPGDNLLLKADFTQPGYGINVTGKGSNNNQPMMGLVKEGNDLRSFNKDTVPARAIIKLNAQQRTLESNLEKYVTLYKPSPQYIKDWKTDLPYIITYNYYVFKENAKSNTNWDAYWRNYSSWQKVSDSLFAITKLNNDAALAADHYAQLIKSFLYYEQHRLLTMAELEPQTFYKEWYQSDTLTGKKLLTDDRKNLLQEKIIKKYFTGKSAEYAYAELFEMADQESAPQNIPEIFERFKSKYPHSRYISLFAPSVNIIIAKRKHTLNDKMVFLPDNGLNINKLEGVVAAMKGKTVLVDMWGTWCGPCREEIEKHSARIRDYFKGKKLDYLYIANFDLKNEEPWKKLIAYFNIEGIHMMANDSLTKDIMTKVKGSGFPTTFIIKRDGTVEQSKTQYPIDENILFSQLQAALKE